MINSALFISFFILFNSIFESLMTFLQIENQADDLFDFFEDWLIKLLQLPQWFIK